MESLSLIITIIAGLAALLFGRQLFWLFVGIVGFLVSFNLATTYLAAQPQWLILLIALAVGLIGALLAVVLQYVAVGIAGFLAGAYALSSLLQILNLTVPDWIAWAVFIVGGIIGAVLVLMLFDWALILLSAAFGATTLVQLTGLSPTINFFLFILLLIVGIAFQAFMLPAGERTTRTRIIRRRRVRES